MIDTGIPIMIGLFVGVLIVSIFLIYVQKQYYRKINNQAVKNVMRLLKEFDKMKTKIVELEKRRK